MNSATAHATVPSEHHTKMKARGEDIGLHGRKSSDTYTILAYTHVAWNVAFDSNTACAHEAHMPYFFKRRRQSHRSGLTMGFVAFMAS